MGGILIIILIAAAIAVFFTLDPSSRSQIIKFVRGTSYRMLGKSDFRQEDSSSITKPDLRVLNCRIQPTIHREGNDVFDAFAVEICGSIHTPGPGQKACLLISILDITEGAQKSRPVRAKVKQWQYGDFQDFSFRSDLGKFPNKVTVLSEWTNVARLKLDWLVFPRRGNRVLQFDIFIFSVENNEEIASSRFIYEHDNPYFGYIDMQENIERSKTLAVALAFSVSAADGKLYDCEVELIKNWARENINTSQTSDNVRQRLEKALDETVDFFRNGNVLNTYDICMEAAEIVPLSNRLDMLDLCLQVAKANGTVVSEELKLIKDITGWLEIDREKFRTMLEKIIPVEMLDSADVETILGVTSEMTGEKARAHLNKEYAKWNSRVTNSDPKIQTQADQMLKLIAEARSQYAKN
jgi:uncharacterized tellurite resistance protein B-like protein